VTRRGGHARDKGPLRSFLADASPKRGDEPGLRQRSNVDTLNVTELPTTIAPKRR